MPCYDSEHCKLEYTGSFPDNLKLIKTVSVFPLEVTAIASCNPRTHSWSYCVGARDTLIGGRITYNRDTNCLVYRKALPLPIFGGVTRPVLAAQWQLGSSWRTPPRLQLGLAVAEEPAAASAIDDGATLRSDGALAFRKKAFLVRRWGVEVDGDLRMQLSHDLVGGGGGGGGNSLRCELTARELNVVLRI